jgi:epoxide hydrolase
MDTISPFRIAIPDTDLDDLHERLDRTRWPDGIGAGWSRGVPLDYLRDLADRWRHRFDWRAQEARLNELPQFTTGVDGQTIHLVHLQSPEPDALPLVLTHGWPSSFAEFAGVAEALADPRSHGGDPADAFHVVVPSVPGFGFSTPLAGEGWGNLFRVAQVWDGIMAALGYGRYGAAGGDVGAGVSGMLGMVAQDRVAAVHVDGPAPYPFGPAIDPDGLPADEADRARRFDDFQRDGLGYLHLQSTRPQTLAYGLTDSPVAQLAWIVEKFQEWTDPAADLPEDAVDIDMLLTTVSVAWFTRSGASSAHFTYEGMQAFRAYVESGEAAGGESGPPVPTGVAVYAGDMSVRSVIDPGGTMAPWTEYDRGGHFPALEVPDLFVRELQGFFRLHRERGITP